MGQMLGNITLNLVNKYQPMNYRIVFYTQFVFLALFLPTLILAPESPGK
jgi:hypothetical protein